MTDPKPHSVQAGDWSLSVSEYPAKGDPVGVVVAGHAMMCNRRTLDRPTGEGLASVLADAGLTAYTFDSRGHGDSGPPASKGGTWSYDELINEDLAEMVTWVKARHPSTPLAIVGHSLLGHGTLAWLGQNPDAPVDAAVVYAANIWLRRFDDSAIRWTKKRAILTAWLLSSKLAGYFPARRLKMGSDDEAIALVKDMNRWASSGQCLRLSDGADYIEGLRNIRPPVLAYAGEKDTLLCAPDCAERFLADIPQHTFRRVPGATHMSFTLSRKSRPVWEETAEWLRESLAKPREAEVLS